MDLNIKYIPNEVNNWEVTRAVAAIIHSESFSPRRDDGRLLNFQVQLNDSPAGGIRNDGTGVLTLPSEELATKFLSFIVAEPVRIKSRKLKFYRSNKAPSRALVETLRKTPYINPDVEEARHDKIQALRDQIRIDTVQFGIFYRPRYPRNGEEPLCSRAFSIEWEQNFINEGTAWLKYDYDHKVIRITLGDPLKKQSGYTISISFSSISKIGIGYDGKPYICFDTIVPPELEEIQFHRAKTGDRRVDDRKFKLRVGSIHEGHAIVAPYCSSLRLLLCDNPYMDDIDMFMRLYEIAGLSKSLIIDCRRKGFGQIEAYRCGFFESKRLHKLHRKLSSFEWPIAFQLESLLRNALLHTGDIDELHPKITALTAKRSRYSSEFVGELLKRYNDALQLRSPRESPSACFDRVRDQFEYSPLDNAFRCYHITFTPTRMILEGPYASQSNRVIRQYPGYEDHFIRVDFRDEDRLQYRWAREVDGAPFLQERVGRTLKEGFSLAGRSFEFLAYSNSALRTHAVWFVNPFQFKPAGHKECMDVNAESIRDSLGDFKGTNLLRRPAKYAARLAQAFTATDPSVNIHEHEWEEVKDLGKLPYLFTDGVGCISKELGNRIWEKLCETKRNPERLIQPSAYMIRFLGYKGVVTVNPFLDEHRDGIHMQLRPSMGKFRAKEADSKNAPLEIAQAFEYPGTCYLYRSLVMLLECVGVRRDAFQELQDMAVADAKTMDDSIRGFCSVLRANRHGSAYRLSEILSRLQTQYHMDFSSDKGNTVAVDNPFLRQLRQVSMNDILRDMKHGARIPVPDSYLLVGVADEGPAWAHEPGFEDVYCLKAGEIYVCIQRSSETEPIWLEGNASISRSPVTHPGDVQRVRAIGKPPAGKRCLFAHLKNVVVMPSIGERSLASCLGGGDVDGDLFSVICYSPLLLNSDQEPATYTPLPEKDLGRDSHVGDICDFIVEYIQSDLLGLLSVRLLIIADQSSEGMFDRDCIFLAELCSHAVDYQKLGTPPDIDNDRLPRTLIRCKPDWHAAEIVDARSTDFYMSTKALGYLYRSIEIVEKFDVPTGIVPTVDPLCDPISRVLLADVQLHLGPSSFVDSYNSSNLLKIYRRYVEELRYICATHTLSNAPGVRLLETEVVVGTILAHCSQVRWRRERTYRMRLHAGNLVHNIQKSLFGNTGAETRMELIEALELCWAAWDLSLRRAKEFGAQSFGLIALGALFDCLDKLNSDVTF